MHVVVCVPAWTTALVASTWLIANAAHLAMPLQATPDRDYSEVLALFAAAVLGFPLALGICVVAARRARADATEDDLADD